MIRNRESTSSRNYDNNQSPPYISIVENGIKWLLEEYGSNWRSVAHDDFSFSPHLRFSKYYDQTTIRHIRSNTPFEIDICLKNYAKQKCYIVPTVLQAIAESTNESLEEKVEYSITVIEPDTTEKYYQITLLATYSFHENYLTLAKLELQSIKGNEPDDVIVTFQRNILQPEA